MNISRKTLLEHIWKTPRIALAKSWELQGSDITKACNLHDIPLPPSGHWTKVRMGHEVKPPILSGDLNTTVEITSTLNKTKIKTRIKTKSQPTELKSEERRKTSTNLLPECRKALKIYSKKGQKKHYQYDYVWPYKEEILRIGVMAEAIKRTIKLFDSLLREFKKRKWEYELPSTSDNQVNTVIINDERIDFVLKEMRRQERVKTDDSWRQYKFIFHSTGNIRIQYGRSGFMYSEIKDTKSVRLEDKIPYIADMLLNVRNSIKNSRLARIDSDHQEHLRYMLKSLVNDAMAYNQSCESNISNICMQHDRSQKIKRLAQHFSDNWPEDSLSDEEKSWLSYLKQKGNDTDPANKRGTISFNAPVDIIVFVKEKIQKDYERYKELLTLNLKSEIHKMVDWENRFGKYK